MGHLPDSPDTMKYLAVVIVSLFAMAASMANAAGILWTHPNGIGFRSGVYGLGLNAYPHSHGLFKREAGPEPVDNVLLAAQYDNYYYNYLYQNGQYSHPFYGRFFY